VISNNKKELHVIVIFSIFTAFLVLGLGTYSLYQLKKMHQIAENIYEHSLKVSNATLIAKLNVIRMNRDIRDVVLFKSEQNLLELTAKLNEAEEKVYKSLHIVKSNILGDRGLSLQKETEILFKNWKPIRDEIIDLVEHKEFVTAIEIIKNRAAKHALSLEESSSNLYKYTHIKAEIFKNESHKVAHRLETTTIFLTLLFFAIFGLLSLYIYKRIKKYMLQISESEKRYLTEKNKLYNTDGTVSKLEIFRDVTADYKMQEELSFNQKYLQAVFDTTSYIMITTDGRETERANPAMLEFFGYEELAAFRHEHKCICDFFLDDESCLKAEMDGVHWLEYILENSQETHKVCMLKDKKRHRFIVQAHELILDKKQRSLVSFSDITEIEELGERLEIAVNGTNDGLWDWNLETGEIYFSPQWKRQLGYEDYELENTLETWEEHVHPDDKDRTVKEYTASIEGKEDLYDNIHRLRHKNGSWVWIRDRGQVKFDGSGKAIRMVGFHTDITKQKELELELIANEKLYYDFFEHTQSANILYSTDDDGRTFYIKALNTLVEELEGVKREDIIGKRVDKVFEGVEEFGLLDIFKEVYRSAKSQKMPITLYDDGERRGWRENYVFKLSNGDIVASYEDRTEEKKLDLLLSNTLNSVKNMIFVKDNNFKYIECNSAFEDFLDLSYSEIVGKSDYDFFSKDMADFFRTKDEEMLATHKMKSNYEWLLYPDGSKHYHLTIKSPLIDDQGDIQGVVGSSIDMTEHKQLEDELNSSREQFKQFMEFMPANIIIKENGIIVYANSKTNDFFHRDTIVGKTVEELFPPEKSKEFIAFEEKAYQHGFHEEIMEITDEMQEVKTYRNMAFTINDEIEKKIGIVSIDITKEYEVNREVTRVLSAFERSDISVVIADLLGSITYVNSSWCKATGYSKEELLGENPRIVKSGSFSAANYEKMWAELREGRVWTCEFKNRAKDGSEFWEYSTIMPSFDSKGRVNGYMAFKLDITDKIHLREELKNQEELMIVQSRHAAMGEMISMIAHQWRQPISVIAMDANNILVDIELDTLESEALKIDVTDIIEQTKHLSQTIDDFRNFFKPNKIKDEVLIEDVYMEALKVIGKSLENNNIEIESNFNSDTLISIYSRELLQVIINILKNAKEALVDNRETDRKILSTIIENNDKILITICDNAGGIKKDIQERIFEPYFSTKDEKNGTGLGLYMSKIIIEKHLKGKFSVSNKGEGSCFMIELLKGSSNE
jgi:PAS domain S-box-containing protein